VILFQTAEDTGATRKVNTWPLPRSNEAQHSLRTVRTDDSKPVSHWCEKSGKAFANVLAWKIVAPCPPLPSFVTM